MWNYLFGGAKQKKELPKKAIVDLREHINTLNKKSSYLESQIQDQEALARKYVTTNKNLARNALKKKKKLEGELLKIENQIESLEVQLGAIESANLNVETMKAMKQGARAIKQMHSDFDIDKVDETMDEIREQVEASEEISEAISRPLGSEFVDEDELDEELAALQEEEINSHMVDTHNYVQNQNIQTPMRLESPTSQRINNLPSAPTKKVQPQQQQLLVEDEDEDERALRELQAEMGM
ncbi:Vacuolar-sorting protein SNF7 [Pichia kudriavzevii]|uniref:Vacuolar-sorting protein SNF7 n=1 Tax=Pichia kudriavzevii TaxID=4909 RepID=A0A1V2LND5_PICKU|nr:Vacuolar-sorting protein SNF7 [Pichia kudriavzevii]